MEFIDAKEEFRNYFILLQQSPWFCKISDIKELGKVVSKCVKTDSNEWQYSVPKLVFKNICLKRHTRPLLVNQKMDNEEGFVNLIMSIDCESDSSIQHTDLSDPIKNLAIKFLIQFEYYLNDNDTKLLQSSWHFDKHKVGLPISSIHPLYHYEFGGTEITKGDEFSYGDFILLDTPRIMHPPMDIILAIDFVLKNYYNNNDHKILTGKSLYKRYVANAQYRIWRPYILSFASRFHNFQDAYTIDSIFAENIIEC